MKNWNQLFVRHGWLVNEKEENIFDCRHETGANKEFLLQILEQAQLSYRYDKKTLVMQSQPIAEGDWISFLDFHYRGRGEGLWFRPGQEEPKVRELDTYICGIVRQLNRLGFFTNGSCDGHDRNSAFVSIVKKENNIEQLVPLLLALGMKRVNYRENRQSYTISFPIKRLELLDLAEKMSVVQEVWLEKGVDYLKEQLFYMQLEELLSIPGESGNEGRIRDVVQEKLTPYVDFITVDRHGNLLAEKTYRTGHGPTLILSAHLDTVEEILENRHIVKENGIWSSSEGILGADDRAGVAVLLNIAETLSHSTTFSGKIKFIFSVEEEVGLVGASKVDDYFLWGTDAAIVVDRRGTGDIVTSCGGYIPFCDAEYGEFIEQVAKDAGWDGWRCTPGGSSDTWIWAQHGIQSVNLSAGYNREHTDKEYLDIRACYGTAQLIQSFLGKGHELRRVLNGIRRKQRVQVN
ncbi:M20/M25/M40 family metallo-hydrolase [Neobacillus niacini]|uniref:M20/M25/M40 family metallo-hydrolase n=1 Tax=Neobacillus niacini TaxID=86668 RepID=UPI002FFE28A8